MLRMGYEYFRYMDDIRIVVQTPAAARKALISLVEILRSIGLGLNSGKTEIQYPGSAQLQTSIEEEDREIEAIEESIRSKDHSSISSIVHLLFEKTQGLLDGGFTADSKFRFCVNRITGLRRYRNLALPEASDLTDAIIELMKHRPAETDTFARYLSATTLTVTQRESI
jgi:hypothetical protein